MDLHSSNTFGLLKNGIIHDYPSLSSNRKTDVVIMGGGITGSLVAWFLCKKGFDVTLVDKRHIGTGSTAASTSLLQYEIDTPLFKLQEYVGEKNAAKSYKLCIRAIYDLKKISDTIKTDTEFEFKKSIQFASFKKHEKDLWQEYTIRKKHGIDVEWLAAEELKNVVGINAPAALRSTVAGQLDAYKFTHALLHTLSARGLKVFDKTEIKKIHHTGKTITLTSRSGNTIQAKHLVIACGYESQKYIPKKIENLMSTYAIVSEPFSQKKLWYENALLWETAVPYLYLRVTKDNRILIGGKDDKFYNAARRDRELPAKARKLEQAFHKLFPQIPFKRDFQWAGTFSSTKDGLPYIGSIRQRPLTSFALGFGGNGITFSIIAAKIICDNLTGKINKDASIFSFER